MARPDRSCVEEVAKEGKGRQLLAAVGEAAKHVPSTERVYIGSHDAPNGRTVVLLESIWDSPEALRAAHTPDKPLPFDKYAHLVDHWTLEYFEEYLDSVPEPDDDREVGPVQTLQAISRPATP